MKNSVEFLMKTASMMLLCFAMIACTGEDGKDGKDGEDGAQGPKGEQGDRGPQGIPGESGVMMYTYGSKTSTLGGVPITGYWNRLQYVLPITNEEVSNSLIYGYYTLGTSGFWYSVDGTGGSGNDYDLSISLSPAGSDGLSTNYTFYLWSIGVSEVRYPTAVTWAAFRAIVVPIPEGNIKPQSAVDFSNYSAVAAYYGLPE